MTARTYAFAAAAIAVLAGLIFVPALHGPWIYDDITLIATNGSVHSFQPGHWFGADFWSAVAPLDSANHLNYWRPLVLASYALDWKLASGEPLLFHVTNLLLHACVTLLVVYTLRRWIGAALPALACAALWALHPAKAETVAWISGRTDLMYVLFVLVALAGAARRMQGARYGLVLEALGTAGAYLSKEAAVVLPALYAVEAWAALGRPAVDRRVVRTVIIRALPQVAVALVYLAVRHFLLPIGSTDPGALTVGTHLQLVLETLGRYAALTFYPHHLSVQQGLIAAYGTYAPSGLYVAIGAALIAGMAVAVVITHRRYPGIAVGLGLFLVLLAPVSNVVTMNMLTIVGERFLYLPTLGLALALGTAAAMVHKRLVYVALAAVALALCARSLSRAADFADERAFWSYELELHPDSGGALAYVLYGEITDEASRRLGALGDLAPAQFAASAAELMSRTIPDRERGMLENLDSFSAAVLAHSTPRAALEALGLHIGVDLDPALIAGLPAVAPRLLAVRADVRGRLDDLDAALALANQARAACSDCDQGREAVALAQARAGRYTDALAVLPASSAERAHILEAQHQSDVAAHTSGSAQVQARIAVRAALGLPGDAYKLIAPHAPELLGTTSARVAYAKIAFVAGEIMVAANLLVGVVPTQALRTTLEQWAVERGWLSRPTSAGGPSSP